MLRERRKRERWEEKDYKKKGNWDRNKRWGKKWKKDKENLEEEKEK